MQTHFSFQNVNEADKRRLENYASEEKMKNFVRLLQPGDYDLADLDIVVEYRAHHNNFTIKMYFKIKKNVLVSEETSFTLTEAFDHALEKIVAQMRKLESKRHKK